MRVKSADGHPLHTERRCFIRIGNPYPVPGRWRCRAMIVDRIKRTGRVVLRPVKGRTGCERMPDQIYVSGDMARGHQPGQ